VCVCVCVKNQGSFGYQQKLLKFFEVIKSVKKIFF